MTMERRQEFQAQLKALRVAEILMTADDEESATSGVIQATGLRPITKDDEVKIAKMVEELGGKLEDEDVAILEKANEAAARAGLRTEEPLMPADLANDAIDLEPEQPEGSANDVVPDPEELAAAGGSDSVPLDPLEQPQEDELTPEQMKEEIKEVLESDDTPQDKLEKAAEIAEEIPLSNDEVKAIAQSLEKDGELTTDNANVLTVMEDEEAMEEVAKDKLEDELPKIEAEAMQMTGNAAVVAEIKSINEDSVPLTEEEREKVDLDEATSETEEAAAAVILMEDDLTPMEKEVAIANMLEGPLSNDEAEEILKMVAKVDKVDREMAEILVDMTDADTVEDFQTVENLGDDIVEILPENQEGDEVPDNAVLHLIGLKMLRFMKKDNKDKLRAVLEKPEAVQFFTDVFDFDKDGKISSQEWTKMYNEDLVAYWRDAIKREIPIPMEEWMTVDLNKDGFIDWSSEIIPTLFDMVEEPIFTTLYSAVFWEYDFDKNGLMDMTPNPRFARLGKESEYRHWLDQPIVQEINAFPAANSEEVKVALDENPKLEEEIVKEDLVKEIQV
jgi:hypothetical protein